MKIRIKDNSVRLRLSQSEVEQIKQQDVVRANIQFGITSETILTYEVRATNLPNISASYQDNLISVQIPEGEILYWADSNQVSIRAQQNITENIQLSILVEKDFQCLTDRSGEDETDLFPHPKEGTLEC